jgi:hypothetical protein
MDHPRLIHQPAAPNKLICGWTTFASGRLYDQHQTADIGIAQQDNGGSMAF